MENSFLFRIATDSIIFNKVIVFVSSQHCAQQLALPVWQGKVKLEVGQVYPESHLPNNNYHQMPHVGMSGKWAGIIWDRPFRKAGGLKTSMLSPATNWYKGGIYRLETCKYIYHSGFACKLYTISLGTCLFLTLEGIGQCMRYMSR